MVGTSMDVLGALRKRVEEAEPDVVRSLLHGVGSGQQKLIQGGHRKVIHPG